MTLDTAETERRDALAGRLFEAAIGAFDLLTIHLGLELGLYEALRDGPLTPGALASRAGIDARYAREWLEQQAVTGILEVDDIAADADARRYSLPAGHAEALLDLDSPAASQAMLRFLASGGQVMPRITAAYRSGGGVAWDQYPGIVVAQEIANRPLFADTLTNEWLPAIADVHARLQAGGARVADIACGTGRSTIAIANAYPGVQVVGLDIDAESIERARANAREAGLGEDRVRFQLADGAGGLDGQFDLALIVEAVHDMSDPVAVLASVKRLLKPGGTLIVADENVQESFTAPGDELERAMYGYSVLFCLPNTRADEGSVATGTVIRPATMRRYASAAGFSSVTILPIDHYVFRLYRLDP
jgi:SAM-dependent methyltransferase